MYVYVCMLCVFVYMYVCAWCLDTKDSSESTGAATKLCYSYDTFLCTVRLYYSKEVDMSPFIVNFPTHNPFQILFHKKRVKKDIYYIYGSDNT